MKLLTRMTRWILKLGIVVGALGALAIGLGRDHNAAYAANPEIIPNLSPSNAAYNGSSILLVKGGHLSALNTPCVPGDSDATTLCVRIWAKDVNVSGGVSAFQVHFTYPQNRLTVSNAATSPGWLSSTGRSAACDEPTVGGGSVLLSCATISSPPPWGPTGTGILSTVAIVSQDVIGPATLNLSSDTYLVNTVANPDNQQQIPATVRSLNIYVAPCADLAGNDGRVTVADILYVVHAYHTTDPGADLDGSGMVLVSDILIAVGEFSALCTR